MELGLVLGTSHDLQLFELLRAKTQRRELQKACQHQVAEGPEHGGSSIFNRRHLERVLRVFTHHYNGHRPHRSLNLTPPDPQQPTLDSISAPRADNIERRDRLGGLIHEYSLAA